MLRKVKRCKECGSANLYLHEIPFENRTGSHIELRCMDCRNSGGVGTFQCFVSKNRVWMYPAESLVLQNRLDAESGIVAPPETVDRIVNNVKRLYDYWAARLSIATAKDVRVHLEDTISEQAAALYTQYPYPVTRELIIAIFDELDGCIR